MNFVDLHVHVSLFDPHGTCGEAACLEFLKSAEVLGVAALVLTPHIRPRRDNALVINHMEQTIARLSSVGKPALYPGSEFSIYSLEDILLLKQDLIPTINKSRYIAVEFEARAELSLMLDCIYELTLSGYEPILVHPERISALQERPRQASQLINEGAILQGTLVCLLNAHGNRARRALLNILSEGYVQLLASDYHQGSYTRLYRQSLSVLERHFGSADIEQLLSINPQRVLVGASLQKAPYAH